MITRRTFLGLAAAVAGAQAQQPKRNVLVILADDLGAGELGCYGHPTHQTPNLDRMARDGVRFETCYATPLCSPTRVELMTGRYGFRTGFTNFIGRVTTRKERLSADEYTFGDMFHTAGYRTGLSGKWQLGLVSKHPTMIHDSGFDEYFSWAWQEGGLPAGHTFPASVRNRYWHPAIVENGKHYPTRPDQYGEDLYSDWIINFMKRQKASGTPFLAYYPMCLVHRPWEPPPDLKNPGSKLEGNLRTNVEYMDHVVGKVLRSIDEMGLRESTVVLFIGDNGTDGDGKASVTEKGVRVPLIVRGPGLRKGLVSRDLVDLSDVLPTLAELTGARPPAGHVLDGRSFAPQLRGEKGNPREWIFSYLAYERMLRDRRWLLEGDGKFYDCGDSRDGSGYKDVTASSDPTVKAARARFAKILEGLPAPPEDPDPGPPRKKKRA